MDPYPIDWTDERGLPPDYRGPIDVWDVDKTYLQSDIESVRGLVRTALEGPRDRRPVPGTVALLAALRRRGGVVRRPEPAPGGGAGGERESRVRAPLYFISASPPLLRRVLEARMRLDGVEYDGIALKDQWALLRRARFRELRHHVVFKLMALMLYRLHWPEGADEWLFGDDAESDAASYTLYADLRAGSLRGEALDAALDRTGVPSDRRRLILEVSARIPCRDSVAGIFIFQVGGKPAADPVALGPRVTSVRDALDAAHHLVRRGRLLPEDADAVAQAMGGGGAL